MARLRAARAISPYPSAVFSVTINWGARASKGQCVSDHSKTAGGHPAGSSSSSVSSQVLMLSLQMQALTLAIEEVRGRVSRIERHLGLHKDDDARADLSKLERIW